ncbi:MAG: NADH-quinone oxidoreductase subunit J, partial [Myxococcales bacterium]|nr:NADH-quinone oxidoreductase subunit J [Myxococcales bacterium]
NCTPPVLTAVQRSLPGAYNITCHKTGVRNGEGGAKVASTVDGVRADVAAKGTIASYELTPTGQVRGRVDQHNDLVGSSGKGMALLFWAFAAATIGGALFVVTRKNLIAAVMGMVGSFLGISAVYMMLYAQFLAVVQMLVYAGAIMVLFVFVVMILNRPEDEPVAPSGRAGQAIGGIAILYLVGRLVMMLMQVQPPNAEVAMAAPRGGTQCVAWSGGMCTQTERYDWGSITAVGTDLFGPGLFPFEAISLLLLIAVVGAIAIARPLHVEDDAPAKARQEGVA